MTSNTDTSNYDRDGNTYKDLVSLLSAKSKKFQDMINSKEFALHEERKTDQLNAYEDNNDEDEQDRPMERAKGKEDKEEKVTKEKVRVNGQLRSYSDCWAVFGIDGFASSVQGAIALWNFTENALYKEIIWLDWLDLYILLLGARCFILLIKFLQNNSDNFSLCFICFVHSAS